MHHPEFGVRWLLRRLSVYPNSYYNYRKHRKAITQLKKEKLEAKIKQIYHEENGVPGYRMMRDYLEMQGEKYSAPTIHKYMQRLKLRSIVRRKPPMYVKGHVHKIFDNLLKQNFHADAPNKLWCTDFTYLPQKDGSMRYNCSIIDLYDRSIVATLNGDHIDAQLAVDTLAIAIAKHRPTDGLILHSDQGSQYTSKKFITYCSTQNIQQSMSKAGCPYDNAPMERFFNTFKHEFFNIFTFETAEELDKKTIEFVYGKYNRKRPHTYNKGLTPHAARCAA